MKTHVSRFAAAAVVAVAVLLGSMIAADRGSAGAPRAPQTIDWQTIAAEPAAVGEIDARPVGEWSGDPVPADPLPPSTVAPQPSTVTNAAEVPLGSFRPSPPVASPSQIAAKVEALEVRVAALESARTVATSPQPSRVVSQPMIANEYAGPTMICAGGVCRVANASARVATYSARAASMPVRRFFRRW